MFTQILHKTYLSKSKLTLKNEYGEPLPHDAEIGQFANINGNMGFELGDINAEPDFYLEGFFREREGDKSEFILACPGPDILYITGIPKYPTPIKPFRLKDQNLVFSSYWEDLNRGYLFQVLKNKTNTLKTIAV